MYLLSVQSSASPNIDDVQSIAHAKYDAVL